MSTTPPPKRAKLETTTHLKASENQEEGHGSDSKHSNHEDSEDNCSICLHCIEDRTVIPKCSHEFCFECLLVWTEQSRRCPLCTQAIGEYLIHSIRSRYDYRKHFLAPLRASPPAQRQGNPPPQNTQQYVMRRRRARERNRRQPDELEEADRLELSILRRRWIYQHDLYAKHVASNAYTRYRPYPSPAQFASSSDLISRTTTFLRRELQVWEGLDVEFLTTLIISLMKSIDIRSESAVKLLSEFLDLDAPYVPGGRHVHAEHFAHEVYCYVRSPYRDLFIYDTIVQYDTPPGILPPAETARSRRWHQRSVSHSPPNTSNRRSIPDEMPRRGRSRSKGSTQSMSWSPSGRRYPSQREHRIEERPAASTSHVNQAGLPRSGNESSDVAGNRSRRREATDNDPAYCGLNYGIASSSKEDFLVNSVPVMDKTSIVPIAPVPEPETANRVQRVDLKGKRRADQIEGTGAQSSRASRDDPLTEQYDAMLAGQPDPQIPLLSSDTDIRSKNVRAPRNRNLRESVHAYLSGSKNNSRPTPQGSLTFKEHPEHNEWRPPGDLSHTDDGEEHEHDLVPSLLRRMFNSSHANILDQAPVFPVVGVSKEAPADNSEAKVLSVEDTHPRMLQDNRGSDASSSTFPESQSRAKAIQPASPSTTCHDPNSLEPDGIGRRISSIQCKRDPSPEEHPSAYKNDHDMSLWVTFKPITSCVDRGVGDTAILHECSTPTSITSAQPSAIEGFPIKRIADSLYPASLHVGSLQQLSIEDSPIRDTAQPKSTSMACGLVNTRTQLMARLAKENQLASSISGIPSSAWSKINQRDGNTLPRDFDPEGISEESKGIEARLRTRAQLRVRLATEKRLA